MFTPPRLVLPTAVSPHLRRWLVAPPDAPPAASTPLDTFLALQADQLALSGDFRRGVARLLDELDRGHSPGTSSGADTGD